MKGENGTRNYDQELMGGIPLSPVLPWNLWGRLGRMAFPNSEKEENPMPHKPITDKDCLRRYFAVGVEAYLLTPWTEETANTARDKLLAEADELERDASTPAPNMRYADAAHLADWMRREASALRGRAESIPEVDFDGAYIRICKERIASLRYYAGLCNGASREDALAAATKIRGATVRLTQEARVALRDTLDELAQLAGYPVWRKTFGRTLLGHEII